MLTVPVDEAAARANLKLLDLIDDHEDVQKVPNLDSR